MEEIKKAQDRLEVLKKIEELETKGIFDVDVEVDPPTIELKPNEIDYKHKKLSDKIKRFFTYKIAGKMLKKLKNDGMFRLNEIEGLENMRSVKTGAIVTCNHFGVIDSFIMDQTFRQAKLKHKRMYKVIREGNYTNPPRGFEPIFKYCDTLPLSQNKDTMKKFLRATNELLQEGNFVLVYPEESMWWNYRKPKPLKTGAFRFAVKNNVPVIPCFVTMEDSDQIGADGFPVQIHTMHILKPIYLDKGLNDKQNIENMKQQNYDMWKALYEKVYNKPLTYLCDKNAK